MYLENSLEGNKKIFYDFLNNGGNSSKYAKILLNYFKANLESLFNGNGSLPYEIEIQPSSICNANCDHCWAKGVEKLENRLMEKSNIDRVAEQILNLKQKGLPKPRVKFCGTTGNPTVNPNIGYFIDKFYGKTRVKMYDNGITIGQNKDNSEYLKDLSKLNFFHLSLDAGTTETLHIKKPGAKKRGVSVENILEGCRKMKELNDKLDIEVCFVITDNNYSEIPIVAKKAKNYEMDYMRYRIDLTKDEIEKERAQEIIELLREAEKESDDNIKIYPVHTDEQIKKKFNFGIKGKNLKCVTSSLWTCIGSNGNIYPCGHCVAKDTESYGNILEQNFEDIWNSEKRKEIQSRLPGKNCSICSPFSLITNEVVTFLLELRKGERDGLLNEYYSSKEYIH